VTITSAAETAFVGDVQNLAENPWIGASEDGNDTDAVFDWVTDEAFGFTSFAAGQPDDDAAFGGNGECLHITDAAGDWNDTNCDIDTFVVGRICEFSLDTCGDGVLQTVNGETCDDTNTTSGDGCDATCLAEAVCGDGVVNGGEECDDTNTTSGDGCSSTCVSELFFSEYVEGSSLNKALEIRNTLGAPFDLGANNCSVRIYQNGSATAATPLALTATIPANDVVVICEDSAGAALASLCDISTGSVVMTFTGDDALELVCGGRRLDLIGDVGFDPGAEWGTGNTSTENNTLRRKCAFQNGDTVDDAFDPSVEWVGFATDTFDGVGSPTCEP
jgi:cysteine-rich repeat protein